MFKLYSPSVLVLLCMLTFMYEVISRRLPTHGQQFNCRARKKGAAHEPLFYLLEKATTFVARHARMRIKVSSNSVCPMVFENARTSRANTKFVLMRLMLLIAASFIHGLDFNCIQIPQNIRSFSHFSTSRPIKWTTQSTKRQQEGWKSHPFQITFRLYLLLT